MNKPRSDKSALERALEVGVYAPLGYMLTRSRTRPALIAAGRKQIAFSRSLGRAALKGMARGRRGASSPAPRVERAPIDEAPIESATIDDAKAASTLATSVATHSQTDQEPAPQLAEPMTTSAAIEGYDVMTAKAIVALTSSATRDQLLWISEHEEANKQRVTVTRAVARRLDTLHG